MKDLPDFSPLPSPLGAIIDLREAGDGRILIGNQTKRVEELSAAIEEALESTSIDIKLLEKIRGRVMFARSLCFGRFAGVALRALNASIGGGSFQVGRGAVRGIVPELRDALRVLAHAVRASPARMIAVTYDAPAIIFTDGACEPGGDGMIASIGGVLIDTASGLYCFLPRTCPRRPSAHCARTRRTQSAPSRFWPS